MFCVELFRALIEGGTSCVWRRRARRGVRCGLHGIGMDAVMTIDVCCNQAVDNQEVDSKKIGLQACCASCDNGYDAMTGVGSDLTNNR